MKKLTLLVVATILSAQLAQAKSGVDHCKLVDNHTTLGSTGIYECQGEDGKLFRRSIDSRPTPPAPNGHCNAGPTIRFQRNANGEIKQSTLRPGFDTCK